MMHNRLTSIAVDVRQVDGILGHAFNKQIKDGCRVFFAELTEYVNGILTPAKQNQ